MTLKEFKEKEIPTLEFEICKPHHVLVQCFYSKSNLASKLIGIEKQATEIKNAFKVIKVREDSTFKLGDVVSVNDSFVDKPIVSYKPAVGNDPNGEARPVFGSYLQGMMPFAFYCHKLEEVDEPLELTFLIPEDLISVKHTIN
jgi:hypothetical protein